MCDDCCGGGDCNVPDEEIELYLEKQLLPFELGDMKFRNDFYVGKIHLRFEAYRGEKWTMLFTLWYGSDFAGFYASPEECLMSDEKLRETLRERLKVTEAEATPVFTFWKEEILPFVAAIN